MFGWMKRKADAAFSKQMANEIDQFTLMLKGADSTALGMSVAMATHWRHHLEGMGFDVMNPQETYERQPFAALQISNLIKTAQKTNPADAAGLMVWLHTMRAGAYLELRYRGQLMWRELASGFPFVETAERDLRAIGADLDITGYDQIPVGMANDRVL